MKPMLILLAEDLAVTSPGLHASSGGYVELYARGCGITPGETVGVDITADGAVLPPVAGFAGVILSGSDAMVTEGAPWMLKAEAWIRANVRSGVPMLGVCFGQQIMTTALGGAVDWMATGPSYRTVALRLEPAAVDDPLLSALAAEPRLQVAHSQIATRLPEGATRLACGPGGIMAARFAASAWGVQPHPEFTAADMALVIGDSRSELAAAGKDPDAAVAALRETPEGPALLRRFREIVETP